MAGRAAVPTATIHCPSPARGGWAIGGIGARFIGVTGGGLVGLLGTGPDREVVGGSANGAMAAGRERDGVPPTGGW